ncbi:MAG: hypothetical protein ACKVY0_27050 [Prosthecobacter sp.]
MSKHYRLWKHLLGFPLVLLALLLMKTAPELSPKWVAGLVMALLLAVAYVAEEIYWMTQRKGRPCGHCGKMVPMKSFTVVATCPHCGQPLK